MILLISRPKKLVHSPFFSGNLVTSFGMTCGERKYHHFRTNPRVSGYWYVGLLLSYRHNRFLLTEREKWAEIQSAKWAQLPIALEYWAHSEESLGIAAAEWSIWGIYFEMRLSISLCQKSNLCPKSRFWHNLKIKTHSIVKSKVTQ